MKFQIKLIESAMKIRIPIAFIRIGKNSNIMLKKGLRLCKFHCLSLLKISLTVSVNGEVNRFIHFQLFICLEFLL